MGHTPEGVRPMILKVKLCLLSSAAKRQDTGSANAKSDERCRLGHSRTVNREVQQESSVATSEVLGKQCPCAEDVESAICRVHRSADCFPVACRVVNACSNIRKRISQRAAVAEVHFRACCRVAKVICAEAEAGSRESGSIDEVDHGARWSHDPDPQVALPRVIDDQIDIEIGSCDNVVGNCKRRGSWSAARVRNGNVAIPLIKEGLTLRKSAGGGDRQAQNEQFFHFCILSKYLDCYTEGLQRMRSTPNVSP